MYTDNEFYLLVLTKFNVYDALAKIIIRPVAIMVKNGCIV